MISFLPARTFPALLVVVGALMSSRLVIAQAQAPDVPLPAPAERITFDTPDCTLKLSAASQTVAALEPKGGNGFDFTPADRLDKRTTNGFYQLGDLIVRTRPAFSTGPYQNYSTAAARQPVRALPTSNHALASSDLSPTLPNDCPLQITRTWEIENKRLVLRFTLRNRTNGPVEIGALGIPLVFNNIITGRSLAQAHEICSFSDPYIGQDAGYVQVTRLSGKGPALIVVPDNKTPFEGYLPLREPTAPSQTFEGMFAWMTHTRAYAENEWKSAQPWNPPTSEILAPGETRTVGLRFLVSDTIRNIEPTLAANHRPVAVGVPGYVLPRDMDGKLFLQYGGRKVANIVSEPKNAIAARVEKTALQDGWQAVTLKGKTWGRVRLTVTYDDGTRQAVHYCVTKPAAQAVADLGRFLTTKQWFDDTRDPFHRAPSAITYDRARDKQVAQDSRVWIAGLSDEAGAGSWLALAMKEFAQPDQAEVAKLSQFVDTVLWGQIQFKNGPNKYGVRKSVFFYEPNQAPGFAYDTAKDWRSWTSWNKAASEDIGRGYNYPHVAAAYWAMYRIARNNPGITTDKPWQWYLEQAYQTTRFAFSKLASGQRRVGYVELGLMDGDVFVALLDDLKRENKTQEAADVEALMRERADKWKNEDYPFGSEMAWDSTGQEEVYAWCKAFGYDIKATVSLSSILGYMPTVPHWGYNGNARRYWDFVYGGAPGPTSRIERQFHHYGSGLNAIPVLSEYRAHPDDFYLLRVGYGGSMGALTNIDQDGFASAAFHSFPSTLAWDAYSGDYGPNFFGHSFTAATYVIDHSVFGWQAFGGNVQTKGDWVSVTPQDALRRRVYIAPRGLFLTLDAGAFERVEINAKTHAARVRLAPANLAAPRAFLRVEQPSKITGVGTYRLQKPTAIERDAFVIPLKEQPVTLELDDK